MSELPGRFSFFLWNGRRPGFSLSWGQKSMRGNKMTWNGGIELHLWIKVSIFIAGAAAGVAAALIIAQVRL